MYDCIKEAGHKTAPDQNANIESTLAMREPSTQDVPILTLGTTGNGEVQPDRKPFMNDRFRGRSQPVDATHSLNRSAGV